MNQQEFYDILTGLNIPVRYDHGEDGLPVPFCYYTFVRATLLNADNKSFATFNNAVVNIVATSKEEINRLTSMLEELLSDNDIPFGDPDEGWDEKEKIYLTTYYLEV